VRQAGRLRNPSSGGGGKGEGIMVGGRSLQSKLIVARGGRRGGARTRAGSRMSIGCLTTREGAVEEGRKRVAGSTTEDGTGGGRR